MSTGDSASSPARRRFGGAATVTDSISRADRSTHSGAGFGFRVRAAQTHGLHEARRTLRRVRRAATTKRRGGSVQRNGSILSVEFSATPRRRNFRDAAAPKSVGSLSASSSRSNPRRAQHRRGRGGARGDGACVRQREDNPMCAANTSAISSHQRRRDHEPSLRRFVSEAGAAQLARRSWLGGRAAFRRGDEALATWRKQPRSLMPASPAINIRRVRYSDVTDFVRLHDQRERFAGIRHGGARAIFNSASLMSWLRRRDGCRVTATVTVGLSVPGRLSARGN